MIYNVNPFHPTLESTQQGVFYTESSLVLPLEQPASPPQPPHRLSRLTSLLPALFYSPSYIIRSFRPAKDIYSSISLSENTIPVAGRHCRDDERILETNAAEALARVVSVVQAEGAIDQ